MSWDADLVLSVGESEHTIKDWNYTHNTSTMFYAVLDDAGYDLGTATYGAPPQEHPRPWWMALDGMTAPEGVEFLNLIIVGLLADPDRFRAMNPPNGWGDYDSVLLVLVAMRDWASAIPQARWKACG